MARPHIPVAVRRTVEFGRIEVQTKGGNWLPMSLLGNPSITALYRDVVRGRTIPMSDVFEFRADDVLDNEQPVPTDTEPTDEPTDEQPTDNQPTDNGPDDKDNDMPDDNSAPPTIESIIRQIAGEMDAKLAHNVLEVVEQAIKDHTPTVTNSNERLTPVLTNVTIHRPDLAPLPVDGLFHKEFPKLLRLVANGAHVYLPGSPGTGKSHAAEQVAQALGWKFGSISFGPTTPESRLLGGMTANGEFFEPMLLQLLRYCMDNPDSGAVYCLDEMDNGHGGVQATLNSLMANGWITAPNGDHLTVGRNLSFVACANTYGTGPTAEFAGRNKLDAATLNRFRMLPWEIDLGVEEVLVRRELPDQQTADAWLDVWRTTRRNVEDHGLKIFVTPRGAVYGAQDIAAGFSIEEAFALNMGNKVPADQLAKINPL